MSETQLPLFDLPEDAVGSGPVGVRRLAKHAAGPPVDTVTVERSVTVAVTVTEKVTIAAGGDVIVVEERVETTAPAEGHEAPRAEEPAPVPAWAERLAVFDLETTGIDVETSRIVTANISLLDADGSTVSRRDWLADPGVPIPEGATAVHGVTTAYARAEGRPAGEVVAEIVAEIRRAFDHGYALVVYNAPYDLTLLNREAIRHGVLPIVAPSPVIDPLVIDKQVDRYRKGKRTLEVAAAFYGVDLLDAHDAGADAIAAGKVAQAIAAKFAAELDLSLHDLHAAQVEWHNAQCDSFEDYMRRTKDPLFTSRRGWPEAVG